MQLANIYYCCTWPRYWHSGSKLSAIVVLIHIPARCCYFSLPLDKDEDDGWLQLDPSKLLWLWTDAVPTYTPRSAKLNFWQQEGWAYKWAFYAHWVEGEDGGKREEDGQDQLNGASYHILWLVLQLRRWMFRKWTLSHFLSAVLNPHHPHQYWVWDVQLLLMWYLYRGTQW